MKMVSLNSSVPYHYAVHTYIHVITDPGPVDAMVMFLDIAAITLAWNKPLILNGIIRRYEIEYADEASSTLVYATHGTRDPRDVYTFFRRRETSKVLIDLKPDTTYNITIRPYNTYPGDLTSMVAKTLSIRKWTRT